MRVAHRARQSDLKTRLDLALDARRPVGVECAAWTSSAFGFTLIMSQAILIWIVFASRATALCSPRRGSHRTFRIPHAGNLADPAVIRHAASSICTRPARSTVTTARANTRRQFVDWEEGGGVVFRRGEAACVGPRRRRDPASGRFYLYSRSQRGAGRRGQSARAVQHAAQVFRQGDRRPYCFARGTGALSLLCAVAWIPHFGPGDERSVRVCGGDQDSAASGVEVGEAQRGGERGGPWIIKHAGGTI
jgi:hypothetical protein